MFFNLEALYHGFIIPWAEAHARHEVCDVRYHNCTGQGRPLLKEESAGIDLCCLPKMYDKLWTVICKSGIATLNFWLKIDLSGFDSRFHTYLTV